MHAIWIDSVPLWLLFVLTIGVVMLSAELGSVLAKYRLRVTGKTAADGPIGAVVGSTLGLLAFLLAFTFGIAAQRFDLRRQMLLEEVNAIGTCYLRAGLVPDEQRQSIRKLLREYVRDRVQLAREREKLTVNLVPFLKRADSLLDQLWAEAEKVAQADPNSEMHSLFVDSLNNVIDSHSKRVVVGLYRIPGSIWAALYVVSILSMVAVGYHFGIHSARDLFVSLFLAFSFSVVILLIADLDNAAIGTLNVSQQPLIELEAKLNSSPQ